MDKHKVDDSIITFNYDAEKPPTNVIQFGDSNSTEHLKLLQKPAGNMRFGAIGGLTFTASTAHRYVSSVRLDVSLGATNVFFTLVNDSALVIS